MEAFKHILCFVYVGFTMACATSVEMNITKHDEMVWKARAEKATTANINAYDPNPHHVTNQLNTNVHK